MNFGLILAGGKGKRVGAEMNKVLLPLLGKPVLYYSLKAFRDVGIFDCLVIVSVEEEWPAVENILRELGIRNYEIVKGGKERQDSVRNGLKAIIATETEQRSENQDEGRPSVLLIHDSARPLITLEEIRSIYEGTRKYKACTLGVLAKDTIKRADENSFVSETLNRSELWQITTPQGFNLDLLKRAYEEAEKSDYIGTDDCSLVERLGKPVKLISGSYRNIKITTKEDLLVAEVFLRDI